VSVVLDDTVEDAVEDAVEMRMRRHSGRNYSLFNTFLLLTEGVK